MSYGMWFLVIFLTALTAMLGTAALLNWWTDRTNRVPLARLADPAPLPGELSRAGRLRLDHLPATGPSGPWLEPEPFDLPDMLAAVYGPWPVDTGPLLILSDKAAANAALEREIRQRCAEAEAKIPPRWR